MIEYHNVEQGSTEWFGLRKERITASNASVLLADGEGIANLLLNGEKEFVGNHWTNRGQELEPIARGLASLELDKKIGEVGFITNSEFPNAGASPDGEIVENGMRVGVEIKCFKKEKHDRIISTMKLPKPVASQIQFQILIADYTYAKLVMYCPESENTLMIFTVKKSVIITKKIIFLLKKYERINNNIR